MYLELELRDAITEEGCSIFTVIFALSAFDKLAKEHRLNKYYGSEHSHPNTFKARQLQFFKKKISIIFVKALRIEIPLIGNRLKVVLLRAQMWAQISQKKASQNTLKGFLCGATRK